MLGGLIEFGGGIALALGLFSRLAGLAIFGDMMMAIITVTWANGINATGGNAGYELNLALGVLALVPPSSAPVASASTRCSNAASCARAHPLLSARSVARIARRCDA